MRKKTYDRAVKKIQAINLGPLGSPIHIMRLLPLDKQPNYNTKLREFYGKKEYEIVLETTGDLNAFKESEDWRENGMLTVHDYKIAINDNLGLAIDEVSNYIAYRPDVNKYYEIVFYREFIGEAHLGLRPVINNAI